MKQPNKNRRALRWVFLTALAATSIALGGCLQTRAQLKNDDYGDRTPDQSTGYQRPTRVEGATGSYAIDELKNELNYVNGRLDELENKNKGEAGGVPPKLLVEIQSRLDQLEQNQKLILEQMEKYKASLPPPDPEYGFKVAQENIKSGLHAEAVEHLTEYLGRNDVKHKEEATFLRGESYYEQKEYKKAISDYAKFIENKFPKSKFRPRALYKIAQSYEQIGWKEDAKVFYQELVEKFPKSPQAKLAKAKLTAKKE